MPFTDLPAPLANLQQQGYLEREFKQALKIKKAYRLGARTIPVPTGVGTTWTETKMGRKAPVIIPLNASNRVNMQTNGITPSTGGDEQWTFFMNEYGDAIPLNLMDQLTTIKKLFIQNAYTTGEQGAQSIEWIVRNGHLNAYMQGDTYVLGSGTTTSAHLNDVRGFQEAMVSGTLQPISGTNTLAAQETGTYTQNLVITGVAVDGTNVSTSAAAGGISGVITFNAISNAPAAGDRILSAVASNVVRANGKATTAALTGSDLLKVQDILNAVKFLRNNGAVTYPDGTFHLPIDEDGIMQLQADPRFLMAW